MAGTINRRDWNPGGAKLSICHGGCPKIIPTGKSKYSQCLKSKCQTCMLNIITKDLQAKLKKCAKTNT